MHELGGGFWPKNSVKAGLPAVGLGPVPVLELAFGNPNPMLGCL